MEFTEEQKQLLDSVNLDELESYQPQIRMGSKSSPEVQLVYFRSAKKKRNDLTFNRSAVDQMKFTKPQYHVAFKFGVPGMLICWPEPPKNEPQFILGYRTDGKSDKALKFSNQIFCQDVIKHFDLALPPDGKTLKIRFNIKEYSKKWILTINESKVI